jgi:SP family sugar:H+ symporter-like MFS transporter
MNKTARPTNTLFIIGITIVATIGGFCSVFDSGVINGTVQELQQAFHLTTVGTGFSVASILVGCAVGAFFADRLGASRNQNCGENIRNRRYAKYYLMGK